MTDVKYIDSLIAKYNLRPMPDGRLYSYIVGGKKAEIEAGKEIVPNKQAILARFAELDEIKAQEDARINAIEGLSELRAYNAALDSYHERVEKIMEAGTGEAWPQEPQAPEQEYPEAIAYLQLEAMAHKTNLAQMGAGQDGIKRVRSGEQTPSEALAQAQKEWSDYCSDHAWD